MTFILRRYCLRGWLSKRWEWQTIKSFDDESIAREAFGTIVRRNGYSDTCRGYELVTPEGAIMSAWSYAMP